MPRLLLVASVPRLLVGFTPDSYHVLVLSEEIAEFIFWVLKVEFCMWFLRYVPRLLGNWVYVPLVLKVFGMFSSYPMVGPWFCCDLQVCVSTSGDF